MPAAPVAAPAPRCWVLDHLSRTGGTSLFAALSEVPGRAAVRQLANGTGAEDAELLLAGPLRIVGGHLAFAPGHALKPHIGYATFLRNPVERAVSVYLHARHLGRSVSGTYVDVAQNASLEAFVESNKPEVRQMISNYYTRHFAAPLVERAPIGQRAARRLAQYQFVGLFERLEESLLLFDALNGWSRTGALPALNASTGQRPALSDRIRTRLVELNDLDLILWSQAKELYANRLREFLRGASRMASPVAARVEAPAASTGPDEPSVLPAEGVRFGNEQIKILIAETFSGAAPLSEFQSGDEATIRVTLFSHIAADDVTVGISILDLHRRVIFGTNLALLGGSFSVAPNHEYRCDFTVRLDIGAGEYSVQAAVHTGLEHTENCFDWVEPAVKFDVAGFRGRAFAGVANLPCAAHVERVGAGRPLSDFRAALSVDPDAGHVDVRNEGSETWPRDGPLPVHLSYRWIDASGAAMPVEGERYDLPRALEPGKTARVPFVPPDPPLGAVGCRVTLVQELVAWFDQAGGPAIDVPVRPGAGV